jgi:hypothetical protein
VISIFRKPTRRIALAIAISMLIHAAILWLPYIQIPQADVQLPLLSVRLEHLHKPVETIATKPEPANPEPPLTESGATAAMDRTDETTEIQPLPKHLQLSYNVYKGTDGFRTGEIIQQLDIHEDRYNLKSVRKTSGLTSLRNTDRLIQTSRGKFGEHGFQPEVFEEEKITKSGKQSVQVTFDHSAQALRYSDGGEDALPAEVQDSLSFMYQLSRLHMTGEFFPLTVSDGTQLQHYQIEIGAKEYIDTPLGKLHALRLRKMHTGGESYFEIWLGLEYRLLPVKFSEVDSSGNVTEEYDITGIRAADE